MLFFYYYSTYIEEQVVVATQLKEKVEPIIKER